MKHLKIQHLSNNPKNTAAVNSTQKITDFRNSKPKSSKRWVRSYPIFETRLPKSEATEATK